MNNNIFKHISVFLNEAIDGLNIKKNGIYVDGTYGNGGHSKLILSKLNKFGRLIAIDRDPYAILNAKKTILDKRFTIKHTLLSKLHDVIQQQGLMGKINGIILDFGMSSMQLDNPKRGFSFMHDGPLDMRMDPTKGQSAYEWLMQAKEHDIIWVLKTYGEEFYAKKIAKEILLHRRNFSKQHMLQTTKNLANLIKNIIPYKKNNKHPATKTFQAIRIYINNELEEIKSVLSETLNILAPSGRLSIISFHSLEDRIVKQFIKKHSQNTKKHTQSFFIKNKTTYINIPILKKLGKKKPTKKEIINNPRSRSSIIRFAEILNKYDTQKI